MGRYPVVAVPPAAFVDAFNASPPPSNITADEVWVVKGRGSARAFFVRAGCLVGVFDLTLEALEKLLGEGA